MNFSLQKCIIALSVGVVKSQCVNRNVSFFGGRIEMYPHKQWAICGSWLCICYSRLEMHSIPMPSHEKSPKQCPISAEWDEWQRPCDVVGLATGWWLLCFLSQTAYLFDLLLFVVVRRLISLAVNVTVHTISCSFSSSSLALASTSATSSFVPSFILCSFEKVS